MIEQLTQRVEQKLQYHSLRRQQAVELAGDIPYQSWITLNQAKNILAQELGWDRSYDPSRKITDSKTTGLIRARNNALRKGEQWQVSDTVKVALEAFIEAREDYRLSTRTIQRQDGAINKLSRLSNYLHQGNLADNSIDDLLSKEASKKRPDILIQQILSLRAVQSKEVAGVEPEPEPVARVTEGRTRGFLNSLKEPLNRIKNIPQEISAAAERGIAGLKRVRNSSVTLRRSLAAGVVVGALGLAMLAGSQLGRESQPMEQKPIPSLASTCPNYDIISRYDWDVKTACQVAEANKSSKAKVNGVMKGVLPVSEEELKQTDPNLDPVHLRPYIENDPGVGIAMAYKVYERYGWKAFKTDSKRSAS